MSVVYGDLSSCRICGQQDQGEIYAIVGIIV